MPKITCFWKIFLANESKFEIILVQNKSNYIGSLTKEVELYDSDDAVNHSANSLQSVIWNAKFDYSFYIVSWCLLLFIIYTVSILFCFWSGFGSGAAVSTDTKCQCVRVFDVLWRSYERITAGFFKTCSAVSLLPSIYYKDLTPRKFEVLYTFKNLWMKFTLKWCDILTCIFL